MGTHYDPRIETINSYRTGLEETIENTSYPKVTLVPLGSRVITQYRIRNDASR